MSGQWKPGDVAMVTFVRKGDPENRNEYGVCYFDAFNSEWVSAHGGRLYPGDRWDVTARPLLVIDPEDREAVVDILLAARDGDSPYTSEIDKAQNYLRSLLPSPKPDEPQGLGAVVVDSAGVEWVRTERRKNIGGTVWSSAFHVSLPDRSEQRAYADIAAIEVLSEGVTP